MLIVPYAHAGRGKTVNAWAACAGKAAILGSKNDVQPIQTVYGVDADRVRKRTKNVADLDDLLRLVPSVPAEWDVIVDDLTRMVLATRTQLEGEYALLDQNGEEKGLDFGMWTVLRRLWSEVLDMLLARPGLVIIPCRQQDYQAPSGSGKFAKPEIFEGPDTGWRKLVKDLTHEAHLVERFEVGDPRWDGRAFCDPLEIKSHKDRISVMGVDRPANTRMLLRGSGVEVTPWKQAWLDEVPGHIAEEVLGGSSTTKVSKAWKAKLKNKPPGLAYMAIRDGLHLAEVKASESLLSII